MPDPVAPAPFVHTLRVRYMECDPQGVVGNHRYLLYFDVAMTEMWREAVGRWDDMVAAHGVDAVVAEATVRFLSPARFDDLLDLAVEVRRLGETAMVIGFRGSIEGRPACEGESRYVFVDAGTHSKTPIPDQIRRALSGYVAGDALGAP